MRAGDIVRKIIIVLVGRRSKGNENGRIIIDCSDQLIINCLFRFRGNGINLDVHNAVSPQ